MSFLSDEIISFLRCNSDTEYTLSLIARKLDVPEYKVAQELKLLLFSNKIKIQLVSNAQNSKNKSRYRTNSNLRPY